jgi:hypothetical protein
MKSGIKYIRRIKIIRDDTEPGILGIKAEGVADFLTSLRPVLIPRKTDEDPGDGIYELDFRLDESPQEIKDVEIEVNVVFRLKNVPSWVKGFRINADENSDIELI